MLSKEQKRRLDEAGWEVAHTTPSGRRTYLQRERTSVCIDSEGVTFKRHFDETKTVDMAEVLEVAAILGIAPPGYRLVKEEVAQAALPALKLCAETEATAGQSMKASLVVNKHRGRKSAFTIGQAAHTLYRAKMLEALASALSPKEEDKPHE